MIINKLLVCFLLIACNSGLGAYGGLINTIITFEVLPGPDGKVGSVDDIPLSAPTIFNSQTSQLTDEFAGDGLIFSPNPGSEDMNEVLDFSSFAPFTPGHTPENGLASRGAARIEGAFLIPIHRIGMDLGFAGDSDLLEIFDAGYNLLGSAVGSLTFVELHSDVPIARFVVTALPSASGLLTPAIDNLTFSSVPEPTFQAIVLIMMAFLGGRQRHYLFHPVA